MSLAYFIVLDTNAPDFDTFVNGKAVAHSYEEITALCQQAGLPAPDAFMGQAVTEFEDILGESLELPEGDDGEEKWFEAEAGIAWVNALISLISRNPAAISRAQAVQDDLIEYKELLEKARNIKAKWHLALDF